MRGGCGAVGWIDGWIDGLAGLRGRSVRGRGRGGYMLRVLRGRGVEVGEGRILWMSWEMR